MDQTSGWSQYEKLVLDKLDSLEQSLESLEETVVLVRIDVARLKVKAGIWGGLGGLVPSALGVLLVLLGAGGS